jgi:hypothetical protein
VIHGLDTSPATSRPSASADPQTSSGLVECSPKFADERRNSFGTSVIKHALHDR